MDAVLWSVQTVTEESQAGRAYSLRVRVGVVTTLAVVIEYYVPQRFRKQSKKWISRALSRRIIPFPAVEKNSMLRRLRLAWSQVSLSNEYDAFRSLVSVRSGPS